MSARMEKVREALAQLRWTHRVTSDTALAEVGEWEQIHAAGWAEQQKLLARAEAAEARLALKDDDLAVAWSERDAARQDRHDALVRAEAAEQWAKMMEHERDYEQQVVAVDLRDRLEAAEAERDTYLRHAEENMAARDELAREIDIAAKALFECVGDAYWIALNPGPGNTKAAQSLWGKLKEIQAISGAWLPTGGGVPAAGDPT